ncbi:MAG: hypothetical protein V1689_16195 [Pseudomonadota bacterium]
MKERQRTVRVFFPKDVKDGIISKNGSEVLNLVTQQPHKRMSL